jgi:hypothetical protein
MAMYAEEGERAPSTGFLRRAIIACRPSAWRSAPFPLAVEAVGSAGQMEMAMLPGYQRLPTACEATFPGDDSTDYGWWSSACLPRAGRRLWGMLTRIILRWRGGDEESAPAASLRDEKGRSSWRPDPANRWPVQGWC